MCKKLSQISTASNRQKHLGARGPTYPRGRSWLSAALFVDRESSSNILDQIIGLQKGCEIILVLTQFDLLALMSDALTIVFQN